MASRLNLPGNVRLPKWAIALAVVALVVFVWARPSKKAKPSAGKVSANSGTVQPSQRPSGSGGKNSPDVLGDLSWGRDPFSRELTARAPRTVSRGSPAPPALQVEIRDTRNLRLTGVTVYGDGAVCVIEGHVLRKGDAVAGYIVEEIQKDRVVLRRDGNVRILRMVGE